MAKYGSDDVVIQIKDGVEGAGDYQALTGDVLDLPGVDKIAESEESHGYGDSWVEVLATGLNRVADMTLRGFYDDTASTGTHALLNRVGSRTDFKVTWGNSKTTEFMVLIKNYKRIATRGELTKFEATLVAVEAPAEV